MNKIITLFLIFLVCCDNKPSKISKSISIDSAYSQPPITPQTKTSPIKTYSFVLIKVIDDSFGTEQVIATEIFETNLDISEDDKYRILDQAQSNIRAYLIGRTVKSRHLLSSLTYATASKEREYLLQINANKKQRSDENFNSISTDSTPVEPWR